ncbi:MAG TPA: 4Fe-4S dicluster domain-containing protein [Kofleriaceae bacterium]|nr:4Fe-4S dicluster domain-containing protein [Kofleriaceae bacterium]
MRIKTRAEVTRRELLKLFAGGIAALEVGCLSRAGDEEIVPYVAEPPEARPGRIVRYASALALDGFATGVIVSTREGRPIKIDGNPAHPASLGGSTAWMQARILDLYDPQRVQRASATWKTLAKRLREAKGPIWIVMPPQSSPTIARLLDRVKQEREVHVVYDAPLARTHIYAGHARAYGRPLEVQHDVAGADVIACLDADPFASGPMAPAWARAAASRRAPGPSMSRIWACEPVPTPSGTIADERLAIPARDVVALAIVIAGELARAPIPKELIDRAAQRLDPRARAWAAALADDLRARKGIVFVGERQPPIVHALARMIDRPTALTEPVLLAPTDDAIARADIVIDCDPVRTRGLDPAIVKGALYVGTYANATARACASFMPLAHELETWSDPRAYDGTLAIAQPALRPRFEVASVIDVLAALAGDPRDARVLIDAPAQREAMRTGVVAGTKAAPVDATPTWPADANDELAALLRDEHAIEIAIAASPQLHDGRFAGNAWLQELPHPITKQTWGNAALLGATTARAMGIADEDVVRIATAHGAIELPALVVDGAADGSITIELGHGQRAPAIAAAVGADACLLGTARIQPGRITRTDRRAPIVRTQTTMTEEGRELVPTITNGEPAQLDHLRGDPPSMLPTRARDGVQWAMSIDTSICTGCSSCMVACQAENNIPTVGPDDVALGRHMNWLRVDRYGSVNQPVACQHCEDAPCEYVCPVGATTHSPDGLNEQVYNRCVGTRFCSNNCPYKVRRFNWFAYETTDDRALQYNPDVTVRSRGVMEKCTYCVQRIRRAEHEALVEKRPIATPTTACQDACPTGAIRFGQLHELADDPRRYDLLHDLGTRPRTRYLARVINPRRRG